MLYTRRRNQPTNQPAIYQNNRGDGCGALLSGMETIGNIDWRMWLMTAKQIKKTKT